MAARKCITGFMFLAISLCWSGFTAQAQSTTSKTRGSGACASCHDTAAQAVKQAFVHGPVAVGQCRTCHTTHVRGGRSKLVATGPRLCFRCHDAKRLDSRAVHRAQGGLGCVACHQPHGSKHRFFVRNGKRLCQRCHKARRVPKGKRSTRPCWHASLAPSPRAKR
ncbi:MAG: hypothetical protein JRH20_25420 [Deltaproteobacteria bacterium]|nr:hypothetical protein [Deltaproteobacteria bacterium]